MDTSLAAPTNPRRVGDLKFGRTAAVGALRRMTLGALLLVLVQAGIGMVVNLYVTIPAHHLGAHPSNYFSGSFHSVMWSIGHGAIALAVHASLGLALVVLTLSVAIRSFTVGRRSVSVTATLASLLVIGAGFNGASFLDFDNNISSLIMTLLAIGAIACYAIMLFLLASPGCGVDPTPAHTSIAGP